MEKFPITKGFAMKSKKSQAWNTQVQRTASGRMKTLSNQIYPAWEIDVSIPVLNDEDAKILNGFVASHKGSYEPFLWLDPEDNHAENVILAPISATQFQAVRQYGSYVEPVDYIEDLTMYVDGTVYGSAYTVDGGVITFITAPVGEVTADFTYYWKVCFADDGISINKIFKNVNSVNLKLEVVR